MGPSLSTKYVLYLPAICCTWRESQHFVVFRSEIADWMWCQKWQELTHVHHSKWPPLCTVNCTTTKSSFTLEIFWLYTWYAKLNFCLFRIWINVFLVVQYRKTIWVSKGPVHDCMHKSCHESNNIKNCLTTEIRQGRVFAMRSTGALQQPTIL